MSRDNVTVPCPLDDGIIPSTTDPLRNDIAQESSATIITTGKPEKDIGIYEW